MKLYYSPGACSLAPHIALEELEIPYDLELVDLKSHTLKSTGQSYFEFNKKGSVPMVELDDGARLTEDAVILQYLADLKPEKELLPAPETFLRFRCMECLNFVATELHKGFAPIFGLERMVSKGECASQLKSSAEKNLANKFSYVSDCLAENNYFLGENYSVADIYLFTIMNWLPKTSLKIESWKPLQEFQDRMMARPAVQRTLKGEGLL